MPVTDFSYTDQPFIPDHPDKLIAEGAFPRDINVIIGRTEDEGIIYLVGESSTIFSSNKYIFLLSDVLGNSTLWDSFRENFNRTGTKSLFMIPFYSDITEEDVARTDQIVEFYLGSYDNITEDNKHKMIDIFTDSGCSFLIKLSSILSIWKVQTMGYTV